jgi:hypothetical protein
MKIDKTKLLLGSVLLALGIILASPVLADLEDDQLNVLQLYTFNEETGEYVPVYPSWYDRENPETFTPPEDCPWWDLDGDGELDWMPPWGRRWSNSVETYGYGGRGGGCGGYGHRSSRRFQPS